MSLPSSLEMPSHSHTIPDASQTPAWQDSCALNCRVALERLDFQPAMPPIDLLIRKTGRFPLCHTIRGRNGLCFMTSTGARSYWLRCISQGYRLRIVLALLSIFLWWTGGQAQEAIDEIFEFFREPQTATVTAPLRGAFAQAVDELRLQLFPDHPRRGDLVRLEVVIRLKPGWMTYPLKQDDKELANVVNQFDLPDTTVLVPLDDWQAPAPLTVQEGPYRKHYYRDSVTFSRNLVVRPEAKPGQHSFSVQGRILVCVKQGNQERCLPPEKFAVQVPLLVLPKSVDVPQEVRAILEKFSTGPQPSTEPRQQERTSSEASAQAPSAKDNLLQRGLLAFILSGMFWGLVSLATPCVFPMIPITVSYFLKQAEKEHHRPVFFALVYSGTIVIVLTLGALLLLGFFQAAIQHWLTNVFIGGLFIYFALSLFGWYEIQLPASLARFTSTREAQGGVLGVVFMALTFTIISFACVAPFLGGFAGLTPSLGNILTMLRQGEFGQLLLVLLILLAGGLAFSLTFASPFFLLALFPTLLKALPKSGNWMNTVKVVMGFLELAAALKFLRAGEKLLLGDAVVLTFDFVLGSYVAIAAACGFYLLGLFRLPHDEPQNAHIGVPRLLFGLAFLTLAAYLLPGLYQAPLPAREGQENYASSMRVRPKGAVYAWLESFLLPDAVPEQALGSIHRGLELALKRKQRLFLNFTGDT
ncbi:MAG: cytochrome c biogenesis protein CcdA [Gemmatales bacterium]|nr:protein-disulfide reductase DsbD family protein [Gemmatales bacterium]MDW8175922.1 cytochrome c biogenesis protein CcdA [Gemmatales bacterium]